MEEQDEHGSGSAEQAAAVTYSHCYRRSFAVVETAGNEDEAEAHEGHGQNHFVCKVSLKRERG